MSEIVRFQTNIPQEVALRFSDGKEVEGQYGPQVLFSLAEPEGAITYLPPIVAERIRELHIGPNERIAICKAEVKNGNRRSIEWQVKRVDPPGQAAAPHPVREIGNDGQPNESSTGAHTNTTSGHGILVLPKPTSNGANGIGGPATGAVCANSAVVLTTPGKAEYGTAMLDFLLQSARATRNAERVLGAEGGSVRFDNRDVAALATTMFIQAAREGWLTWRLS